jgi:YYY domain-containing protein
MEFAFLNGVLGSHFFPPQDPWLSGYAISYYYFGYVMLAALVRLSGVAPSVAFNLGVATWFALTLLGAFSVVYDLVRAAALRRLPAWTAGARATPGSAQAVATRPPGIGRGIRYGLLGALLVGILGNLEGLLEMAYNASLVPLRWIQWFDIKDLTGSAPTGALSGGFWWWWHASRVVHDQLLGNTFEVIDEFPFFSFLLGDLHPHVLALPFALLAIALALNLLLETTDLRLQATPPQAAVGRAGSESPVASLFRSFWSFLGHATGLGGPGIFLYALALGALSFLNTWDFPIYLVLVALALGIGLASNHGLGRAVFGRVIGAGVLFGLLGVLLYLPFYLGFQSQAGGILPNLFFPTRFGQYFLMFGPFLVVAVFFLLVVAHELPRNEWLGRALRLLFWLVLLPVLFLGLLLVSALVLPAPLGTAVGDLVFRSNGQVANALGDRTTGQAAALVLQLRAANPWTFLVVAGLIAWAGGVLWSYFSTAEPQDAGSTESLATGAGTDLTRSRAAKDALCSPVTIDLFVVLMIGVALLLTLAVEFVFLKDYFSSRMNTVFKFYYQAWILLALAAGYGLSRLAERETRPAYALPGLGLAGLLMLGGLYYPLQATPSKAGGFQSQPAQAGSLCPGVPSLDGLAFLCRTDPGDFAAIGWLRANVPPTATVLEAAGGSYSAEGAERVSMSTGNPTLFGWDFHERQWRGKSFDEVAGGRPEAVQAIYRTASATELPALLERWGIDYVYIGDLERRKYGINDASLARFDRALKLVYDKDGVRIYAR